MVAVGAAHDKFRFLDFSLDLTTRYTFWSGLVVGTFYLLTQYGVDQSDLQRFMAPRSLRDGNVSLEELPSRLKGLLVPGVLLAAMSTISACSTR